MSQAVSLRSNSRSESRSVFYYSGEDPPGLRLLSLT